MSTFRISYAAAADRHFRDGEFLQRDKRFENADQLLGVAAECALKAIMVGLGAPANQAGELSTKSQRVHINELWGEFVSFARNTTGTRILSKLPPGEPFGDWGIEQRYAADGLVGTRETGQHQSVTKRVMAALERAREEGIVA